MKFSIMFCILFFSTLGFSQEVLEEHMLRIEIVKDTIITQEFIDEKAEPLMIKGDKFIPVSKRDIPARLVRYFYYLDDQKTKAYVEEKLVPKPTK